MPKFLVQVSGNADLEVEVEEHLDAMYTSDHFVVEAKDADDAAQIALLHSHNMPESGIHLLESVGDKWSSWSNQYTVLDIVPPPVDMPDPTAEAIDARTEFLHQHTVGYFMIVGPLKEN